MDRRNFIKKLTAGSAAAPALLTASTEETQSATPINVVVVGGGMAGASVAKYLRYWGMKQGVDVRVTIVDQNASYVSCIMSNGVLIGERSLSSLTYNYATLISKYGANGTLKFVNSKVTGIDKTRKLVALANGTTLPYTRLVLAPGIDMDYSSINITWSNQALTRDQALEKIPHAWKAGPQTTALQQQLANLKNGNSVIITIPKPPYRCPPGPYERACVIADWMKTHKPASKVIVLDANDKILAEPNNFGAAFAGIHKSYIDYHRNMQLKAVNIVSDTLKTVTVQDTTNSAAPVTRTFNAEVVNLLPPMQAGQLARDTLGAAGLSTDGRWALIDEQSYRSKAYPDIHVIGDSIFSIQPKAGHIGNQEAKICADAILRLETNQALLKAPVTNSACFTPITTTAGPSGPTATWLTALYRFNPDTNPATGKPFGLQLVSGNGAPSETTTGRSRDNYESMNEWFAALMQDVFA